MRVNIILVLILFNIIHVPKVYTQENKAQICSDELLEISNSIRNFVKESIENRNYYVIDTTFPENIRITDFANIAIPFNENMKYLLKKAVENNLGMEPINYDFNIWIFNAIDLEKNLIILDCIGGWISGTSPNRIVNASPPGGGSGYEKHQSGVR